MITLHLPLYAFTFEVQVKATSSMRRFGLVCWRVERRGKGGGGVEVESFTRGGCSAPGIAAGGAIGMRRRKKRRFLTRTRPLAVFTKYLRCGLMAVTM